MKTFTDLLDNYLLALGTFNQVHNAYTTDPLRYTKEYEVASRALVESKKQLNGFFFEEPADNNSILA